MFKRILIAFSSVVLTALLILSIPMLNFIIQGSGQKKELKQVAKISVKKVDIKKMEEKPKRKLNKPQRSKPSRSKMASGPRFAMDLGVMGMGGVALDLNRVQGKGAAGGEDGQVDEKPSQNFPPSFNIPGRVKEEEINSLAIISFCVDAVGRAYDIQVIQEEPPGLGMGEAGREAIRKGSYQPAVKDGRPVPFCGMEQPFEVKFEG